MKKEQEYMPGSVFTAQRNPALDECNEILDQYSEEAIELAADQIRSQQ